MVAAPGVTLQGDKVFLGLVQTDTENTRVIATFLRSLVERGLVSVGQSPGGDRRRPGLKAGVTTVFRGQVLIQRCQWHKRENVVSYLARPNERAGPRSQLRSLTPSPGSGGYSATATSRCFAPPFRSNSGSHIRIAPFTPPPEYLGRHSSFS